LERFKPFSGNTIGLILALSLLVPLVIAPYLFNGRTGPMGFPWVFISAVISQFLVLMVCIYVAVFLWKEKREGGP
jgi:uncharacterized membrane protein YhdT